MEKISTFLSSFFVKSSIETSPIDKFLDFEFHLLEWYEYIIYIACSALCLFFAGLMSGLSLGLLSFDRMTLEILTTTGSKREKKQAAKIAKLVKHKHWLLCTLLIMNAIAFEALPIFLDELVPSLIAIIISVTFILIVGEILPQSIISRYALAIGSFSFPLVIFLMAVSSPISWPLAKILDCLLGGDHVTYYRRAQLKELVQLHGKDGRKTTAKGELPLNGDEINVIRGALELTNLTISAIMTDINNVFMLADDSVLDMNTLETIETRGHSRIPVYHDSKENIVGLLLAKTLISVNPQDAIPMKSAFVQKRLKKIYGVNEDTPIWDVLNVFQEGKAHLALVFKVNKDEKTDNDDEDLTTGKKKVIFYDATKVVGKKKVIGIVTLEDVIEELIQEEIIDETDVYVDLNTHLRVADLYRRLSVYRSRKKVVEEKEKLHDIDLNENKFKKSFKLKNLKNTVKSKVKKELKQMKKGLLEKEDSSDIITEPIL